MNTLKDQTFMGIMQTESVSNVSHRKAEIPLKNLNILYVRTSFFFLSIWVLRSAQPAKMIYIYFGSHSLRINTFGDLEQKWENKKASQQDAATSAKNSLLMSDTVP